MRGLERDGGGAGASAARYALWALYAFTAMALAGYASFGTHPELLARYPGAAGFYGVSFLFFARVQILLAGAAIALFLAVYAGRRWLGAFAALYVISLGSELLGTTAGIPFGAYAYTEALGPRWFGHVPLLIPLSWFFMAVPSYALARGLLPIGSRTWERVLLASFVLLSWDLSLDPAMSHATRYWEWASPGPYYGMPLLNLFGWYATGAALMGALAALRADAWVERLPLGWLTGFYAANLLLPLGMILARGYWPAALVTVAALGAAVLLARLRAPRRRATLATAEAAT
ncbi:MAG TPA: carotenoid biosynthesis protein [Longimicrobium sp.]|nr:carotenoid biosynthesis protein [Longimicrobium sp.]